MVTCCNTITFPCMCVRATASLGPRPNQPQHRSLLVSHVGVIPEAIHVLDKRSGNETKLQHGSQYCIAHTVYCTKTKEHNHESEGLNNSSRLTSRIGRCRRPHPAFVTCSTMQHLYKYCKCTLIPRPPRPAFEAKKAAHGGLGTRLQ